MRFRILGRARAVEHVVKVLLVTIKQAAFLVLEEFQDVVYFAVDDPALVLKQPLDFGFPALFFLFELGAVACVAAVPAKIGVAEIVVDALVEYSRPADNPLLALRGVRLVDQTLPFFSILMNLFFLAGIRVGDPLVHAISAPFDGGYFGF